MRVRIVPMAFVMRCAPKHWAAFALGDTIYLRGERISPSLLAHEMTHVAQFAEAGGVLRGLWRWLRLLARHGYDDHPWEREARSVEQRVANDPAAASALFPKRNDARES
jgi:hypothetical protein